MPTLNPLRRLSRRNDQVLEEALANKIEEDLPSSFPSMSIIEQKHAESNDERMRLEGEKLRLEQEIDERQEKLRETNVALDAEKARAKILEEGKKPLVVNAAKMLRGSSVEAAAADKVAGSLGDTVKTTNSEVGRLVPRHASAGVAS